MQSCWLTLPSRLSWALSRSVSVSVSVSVSKLPCTNVSYCGLQTKRELFVFTFYNLSRIATPRADKPMNQQTTSTKASVSVHQCHWRQTWASGDLKRATAALSKRCACTRFPTSCIVTSPTTPSRIRQHGIRTHPRIRVHKQTINTCLLHERASERASYGASANAVYVCMSCSMQTEV